jgi:hypothetical protein
MNSELDTTLTSAEMLPTDLTTEWSDDQWMNFKTWLEGILMSKAKIEKEK